MNDALSFSVPDIVSLAEDLQPEERAGLLTALMTLYCPECGYTHDTCACESSQDLGIAEALTMGTMALEDDPDDDGAVG